MRLVTPRSEVVVDDDWTWLQPVVSSTRLRHTLGTFLLAVLILAGGATATLLPPPSSVSATVGVAAVGLWLFVAVVRSAGSRVGVSGLGLYLQNGGSAYQVGWPAIQGVHTTPAGARVRLVIDDGYRPRTTRATFDPAVTRSWVEIAVAEASRRQLHPQPRPDGLGFSTDAGA